MRSALRLVAAVLLAGCSPTAGVNWSSDGRPGGFFGTTIQESFGR